MKKFIIQSLILLILIFLSLAFASGKLLFPKRIETEKGAVYINNVKIEVEVADNKEERNKGLGGRESLASDSGMLFIFDSPGVVNFWMKGLNFPLDFIWIRGNKVVDFIKNVPPPESNQPDETLPIIVPNQSVDMVLEVNTGFVDRHNIRVGDIVNITL